MSAIQIKFPALTLEAGRRALARIRERGLLDYRLDLPYSGDDVVLYPHFTDRIIPGCFDKGMPWRRGDAMRLREVLPTPSRDHLARLPYGKLPAPKDFSRLLGDDAGGERYWRQAREPAHGRRILELAETGRLAGRPVPP